jgi:prepilin peptidase CpaA
MASLSLISLTSILGFLGLLYASAISDLRSLTIPNRYALAVALLYPAYLLSTNQPIDWLGAIIVAGSLLALGFVLFALNTLGGGDAKFLAAVSLWAGPALLLDFVLLTALMGGAMAIFMWLRHRYRRASDIADLLTGDADPDFAKQPMPYGVAIATGGVYVAFTLLGLV